MAEAEKQFFIGIAAPTNAGKTTLMSELQERLGGDLTVVNFDDYDLYPEGSVRMEEELANPKITNWEDPKLFDYIKYLQDLHYLKAGLPINMNSLSRENQGTSDRILTPRAFNVVEGIFVLAYPAARLLFDLKYYLDLSEEEMVRRRLARTPNHDMPWDKLAYINGPMIQGTRDHIAPQKKFADKILDATRPSADLADEIVFDLNKLRQPS